MVQIIVACLTLIGVLSGTISNYVISKQNVKKEDLKNEIEDLRGQLKKETTELKLENCKNYLVSAIVKAESGQQLAPIETELFFENYDIYISNGGDSFIHTATEKLKKEGKI